MAARISRRPRAAGGGGGNGRAARVWAAAGLASASGAPAYKACRARVPGGHGPVRSVRVFFNNYTQKKIKKKY